MVRLVAPDEGLTIDDEPQAIATEVSDTAEQSAEEAAIHLTDRP